MLESITSGPYSCEAETRSSDNAAHRRASGLTRCQPGSCLSVCVSGCLCVLVCSSAGQSVCPSICLLINLSVHMPVCMSVHQSVLPVSPTQAFLSSRRDGPAGRDMDRLAHGEGSHKEYIWRDCDVFPFVTKMNACFHMRCCFMICA